MVFLWNRCFCLAHPVDAAGVVDAGDSLAPPQSPALERHLDAQVFDISAMALWRRVLPTLAMAVFAEIALFALAISILHDFVIGATRAVHAQSHIIISLVATPFFRA